VGVGHGANSPQKHLLLQNHGGGQDPHRGVVPVKKEGEEEEKEGRISR
jgi:hypothetical protein